MAKKLITGFLGMEQLKKIHKKIKKDTVKELVCSFRRSILVIKLVMLDEDMREYLLYSLLSMYFTMEKQLTLPDALFTRTESNEDCTRQGLPGKTSAHYGKIREV